jgi:hypothetical protein
VACVLVTDQDYISTANNVQEKLQWRTDGVLADNVFHVLVLQASTFRQWSATLILNPTLSSPTQANPTQTNPNQTNPTQTNPIQTKPTQTNPTLPTYLPNDYLWAKLQR